MYDGVIQYWVRLEPPLSGAVGIMRLMGMFLNAAKQNT